MAPSAMPDSVSLFLGATLWSLLTSQWPFTVINRATPRSRRGSAVDYVIGYGGPVELTANFR
ncbi:hypothetical protein PGTUg99_027698 [Puccinia graminis f. sp. tritici]|uniref:Uncharacterized protein n=1 Tax=Puccinia graminis f. sp. tritici TaxID=56615 RepID=A0A5B0Q4U0_PUCGR|nr:hypothetical protein PGTUg99_027698 [Puccinia graminis f. sp. tritici]